LDADGPDYGSVWQSPQTLEIVGWFGWFLSVLSGLTVSELDPLPSVVGCFRFVFVKLAWGVLF